jgi:hypothetical protein
VLDVIRAWVACRRPTKFKTVSITLPAASNAQHPPQTVPQRSRLQRPPFVGVTSHGAGARCHSESTNPTSVDEAGEGHHQHRLSDQFYGIACSRHCKESEPRFSNWFGYILTTNCVPRHHHAAGNGTRASPEAEHRDDTASYYRDAIALGIAAQRARSSWLQGSFCGII